MKTKSFKRFPPLKPLFPHGETLTQKRSRAGKMSGEARKKKDSGYDWGKLSRLGNEKQGIGVGSRKKPIL